ncbi:Alpha/Beta hydrolase protein [Microdochium trichocladiopsis]|uniref:Alpha/Beta hydrolase protein n=1 Tax=Microdochium trichocladiopsis TaxID=1682393 RepID=A0A9P8YFD2_9PEZI|nr:Alpha/Beta hydrolase protein [Microdochium trichocladiopsis]KAH7035936.1 Alpha/Beta hydrolase protein [Microdochium trichocladiopsis]
MQALRLSLVAALLSLAAAAPPGPPPPPRGSPKPACCPANTVNLPQGPVRGFADDSGNSVFLGIPFAATTGGQNRWKAPQPVPKAAPGVTFDATSYGPTCPQAIRDPTFTRQDENCLNLNIWAPAGAKNLPVFVYMYGGAMVTGSNSNPQIQGSNFARNGVIYVNFNTRESIWAYPNSGALGPSQNFGILDVNQALDWVHDNIAAFGGDPNHIVFGGHSSGSVQVDHYLWNHPSTFLKGAVQMSANAESGPAYAPRNEAMDAVAAEVGCPSFAAGGQLECMRNVDFLKMETSFFNSTSNTWFTPTIDDVTRFSNYPARFAQGKYASQVPLLTGTSNGEGTIFSLVYGFENSNFSSWINTFDADSQHIPDADLIAAYPPSEFGNSDPARSGAQYGDARFNCPVDYLLDLRVQKQPTWVYRFFGAYDNVVGGPPGTAPTHGTEVPFFHGGNECFSSLSGVTAEEQALADAIFGWFVQWIKNPAAGPGWAPVTTTKTGPLVKLGVPGDELTRIPATRQEFNARCQSVYAPNFPKYPVVQSIKSLLP